MERSDGSSFVKSRSFVYKNTKWATQQKQHKGTEFSLKMKYRNTPRCEEVIAKTETRPNYPQAPLFPFPLSRPGSGRVTKRSTRTTKYHGARTQVPHGRGHGKSFLPPLFMSLVVRSVTRRDVSRSPSLLARGDDIRAVFFFFYMPVALGGFPNRKFQRRLSRQFENSACS